MNKIIILLSTYNGSKYLKNQLTSLASQTYKEFEIIARDDGSSDKSYDLLSKFTESSSLHVRVLPNHTNLGVKKSFELLAREALEGGANYMMFCDQDDIWEPEKVEKSLQKMQELEKFYPDTPLLVHTDLHVVDENLHLLDNSFWHYQNLDPSKDSLNRALMQNIVTGCTMMINRKLALLSLPIANEAIMHDWWIALVATQFGKIDFLDEQTMKYRQHSSNDTGAKKFNTQFIIKRIKELQEINFDKHIAQATAFLNHFQDQLDPDALRMLEEFTTIKEKPFFQRRKILIKHKLLKQGFIRNIAVMLKI